MALQVGALSSPMAALVMALLLCVLLGCAAIAYVARKLTTPRLRPPAPNDRQTPRAA